MRKIRLRLYKGITLLELVMKFMRSLDSFWGRSEVVTPASSMLDKKLDFSIAKLVTNELLQVGKSPSAQCLVLIGKLIVMHA